MLSYREMLEKRSPCFKCLNFKRNEEGRDDVTCDIPGEYLSCSVLTELVHNWEENKNKESLWNLKCFAFCDDIEEMDKILNSIYKGKNNGDKLTPDQYRGLSKVYYEETHKALLGPPKGEPTEARARIIKNKPILDGPSGGIGTYKGWEGYGFNLDAAKNIEKRKTAKNKVKR